MHNFPSFNLYIMGYSEQVLSETSVYHSSQTGTVARSQLDSAHVLIESAMVFGVLVSRTF